METNRHIVWQRGKLTHDDRRRVTGQRPLVMWFTGLSGSGKSTVAVEAEARLNRMGYAAYLLDGDNLRYGLNSGLGFSEEDRAENVRRIAEAARLLADSGQIVLVSAISPMRAMRVRARERISEICPFAEVYVNAGLEECIRRDTKGLYKKAMNGEIRDFTGISSPYEAPESPDLLLDAAGSSVDECAEQVVRYVLSHQFDYAAALDILIPTAIEAGRRIMDIYEHGFAVEMKDDRSPLTNADRASNEVICRVLEKEFPYCSILSEESADDRRRLYNRWCFIVDPLDGTKEFISRNGEFTVNIALAFDHRAVLGVIYVPATGELFYAAQGMGAYKRLPEGEPIPIHVSERTERLIVMNSRSHGGDNRLSEMLEKNAARIGDFISSGSSIKGCRIAEGAADVYYRYGYTMEWDTAAMQCICEEAGAIVRQLDEYDTPLRYNRLYTRNDKGFYIINRPASRLH